MTALPYHGGTTLYIGAIAACVGASALPSVPPNFVFTNAARASAMMIGVMFSSASDMAGTKDVWKTIAKELGDAHIDLNAITSFIDPSKWEKMGKEEFDAASKKFYAEIEKTKDCCDNLGDALGHAALISFITAVLVSVGASILLKVAIAKTAATGAGPIAKAIAESIATTFGTTFKNSLTKTVKNKSKALLMIGGIVGGGVMLLQMLTSFLQQPFSQAATPMDMNSTPMFEQVFIEGLPQSSSTEKSDKEP
ncbi:uncharacterized protein YukE [Streptosporangium album]|uniref:Uncharacterized protein YukE n=1 Tax=Streptosporangium album TaxID=47479 RepID=A0A7W7W8I7_9ACTN|nr:hypothetical protein [Streptosporangium album]MBB4937139.1 uncharacterized protein YukE [Streptosporangium album]